MEVGKGETKNTGKNRIKEENHEVTGILNIFFVLSSPLNKKKK